MVTFYADENVDGPITVGLLRRGIDVLTIQADGRAWLQTRWFWIGRRYLIEC
jgi:hypothetical protein